MAPLQDTNDYFLANMQKDGTYSVVPRMPGGEITPDKLIAIGAGRQEVRPVHQDHRRPAHRPVRRAGRPAAADIWSELIAAGFEIRPCLRQGAAHGEVAASARTWCRYGVQDSVGLAIELENRYKGLRSPHKIKFAVSGCTRECAEAQSKDVGVIATEKGWNLYVCGNGGMKPRHADLLAQRPGRRTR